MENKNFRYFEFSEFRIDLRRRILTKNGEIVPLSPRNFDLLLFLVENEGRLLSHDELLDAVWEGTFVEQSNLKAAISVLRHALGESPNQSLFIKTIPRKGYRFVSQVRQLPDDSFNESVWVHRTDTQIIVEEEFEDEDEEFDAVEIKPNSQVKEIVKPQKFLEGKPNQDFWQKLKQWKIAAAIIAVLILIAGGYGLKTYFSKSAFNFSIENVRLTKLTSEGNLTYVGASQDGKYLLYTTPEKDGVVLYVRQLSTGVITKLTPPTRANFWFLNFTSDGSSIYYGINHSEAEKSGLYQVSLLGGTPQRISKNPVGAVFSPDDRQMAFVRVMPDRENEIVVANPDGSNERQIKVYADNFRIWSVSWSPDGTKLLCAVRRAVEGRYLSYVTELSFDGKENVIMPEREAAFLSATWLPDKKSLLYLESNPNAEIRQIWQYFPATGEQRRVTNDDYSYLRLTVLRDGKSAIAAQEAILASIWIGDADGKNFRQVAGGAANIERVAWTADGRLVYLIIEGGAVKIYTVSPDGKNKRQLTEGNDGAFLRSAVSMDGNSVTFQSKRSGTSAIWQITMDGKTVRQLTEEARQYSYSKLLSDGETLIYDFYTPPFPWVVYRKKPDGQIEQLNDVDTDSWSVSPDEKFLAYYALDKTAGKSRVFIRSLESGETAKVLDSETWTGLSWTRDAKALTYYVNTVESGKIIRISLENGERQVVAEFPNEQIFGFDWSFDGKQLAVARGKIVSDAVLIKAE